MQGLAKHENKDKVTYTLEKYLQREDRSIHKHQFFNGKIVRMAGAKANHNQIAAQISSAIIVAVRELEKRYKVYNSDQKIYIASHQSVLYPDALVISENPEFWKGRKDLIVNPLVVVEVLSDSTKVYDKFEKFHLYQSMSSFREYIVVEQNKPEIETWFRLEENIWEKKIISGLDNSLTLRSIGVNIELSDIYYDIDFSSK